MSRFGYTISKARVIDYESNDRSISDYIAAKDPSFLRCIECGCCSATCTAAGFTKLSLREINILVKRGENETIYRTIKKCMLCGKCTLVCPRGVNTRNIITLIKEEYRKSEKYAV